MEAQCFALAYVIRGKLHLRFQSEKAAFDKLCGRYAYPGSLYLFPCRNRYGHYIWIFETEQAAHNMMREWLAMGELILAPESEEYGHY